MELNKNMDLNKDIKENGETEIVKKIICKDLFYMNIKASEKYYCYPKKYEVIYTHVEVSYLSMKVDELMKYTEDHDISTKTIYKYVPVKLVEKIIEDHGGLYTDDIIYVCDNCHTQVNIPRDNINVVSDNKYIIWCETCEEWYDLI